MKNASDSNVLIRQLLLTGAVCLTAVLTACATAPVQIMSDARQAVAAAREAGAAQKAPAELALAEHYLEVAERALRHHNFDLTRASARRAKHAAVGALQLSRQSGQSDASSGLEESRDGHLQGRN